VLCDCLGYDENVRQVLIERVEETLYSYGESVSNG
jgi:sirohydrochlorin ferrochelatase